MSGEFNRHSAKLAFAFAKEYTKNTPKRQRSYLDLTLYVDNALSKKGFIIDKNVIKKFLLTPEPIPSKGSASSVNSNQKNDSNRDEAVKKKVPDGKKGDGVDESNCGNIGEKTLQLTTPKTSTKILDEKATEKKCEKTAKEDISVGKSDTDTIIATPKKQIKPENEVNVSQFPERNERSASALKGLGSGATDVSCAQGDGVNESNNGRPNSEENIPQTITLEHNNYTKHVDRKATENKCSETAKEEIPVEKSDTCAIISTPNKQKTIEVKDGISKISKRNTRASISSDSPKIDISILNVESKKTGSNNDVPKMGFLKTYSREDRKSLKLNQTPDAPPVMKRRRSGASDVSCPQGATKEATPSKSDGNDESNSNCIDNLRLKSSTLESNTEIVDKKVTQEKSNETNKKDIPDENCDTDTIIATPKKQMPKNEVTITSKVSCTKKQNDRSACISDSFKIDTTLDLENNKTGANISVPKTCTPNSYKKTKKTCKQDKKTCKQDKKSLNLEKSHSAQPAVKRQRSCDTDVASPQGDGVNESDKIGEKVLQTNTLEKNTKHVDVETTQNKSEETSKQEISVGTSDTSTSIVTPKKQKTIEMEVGVSKIVDRPRRKTRSASISSDSPKIDIALLNVEMNKSGSKSDVPKTGFPKSSKEDGVSLTLKQTHDAPRAMKRRRSGATDVLCPQGDGVNESNSGKSKEKVVQTITLEKNSKHVDGVATANKCEETSKEEISVEKSDPCTSIVRATSKKQKTIEMEVGVSNILDIPKRKTRSASISTDSPKIDIALVNVEINNSGSNNDVPKTGFQKTSKEDGKSLKLRKTQDVPPATKRRRSGTADVSCPQDTTQCVPDIEKQELLTEVKHAPNTKLKWPPGPKRIAYLRNRKQKYNLKKLEPATPEPCPEAVETKEEPPEASTMEESVEYKEVPFTTEPVPQMPTDYYASEKVEVCVSDMKDVEPLHSPFKRIRLQLPTPQAPPLCSFRDVLPILDSVTPSDTKDQPDPTPHLPAVTDVHNAVDSSTQSVASLPFTMTMTEDTSTGTAVVSETDTAHSSQGDNDYTRLKEALLNELSVQMTRVEEKLLHRFEDLQKNILETLRSSAKSSH